MSGLNLKYLLNYYISALFISIIWIDMHSLFFDDVAGDPEVVQKDKILFCL